MGAQHFERLWRALSTIGPVFGLSVLVAFPAVAYAQNVWRLNGVAAPSQPNAASKGGFSILQLATRDPDQLMADWNKPTPGVSVKLSTQTPRNQPIVTFIVFGGCQVDATGNCNVTADFETIGPSGASYDRSNSVPVWVGHPGALENHIQLSQSGYGLVFENKDAVGEYRINATVTDHVAHITLQTWQVITVVEK